MSAVIPYKNFINEDVDETTDENPKRKYVKVEKRKMKLFISAGLKELLEKMMKTADFQAKAIANKILNIDQDPEENSYDFSYIDIDKEKDDSVTFMPAQRAWAKMGWKTQEEADTPPTMDSPLWEAAGRQSLVIGKFTNKIFDNFSEIAVDKFIRSFKAEISATKIYDRFKLVDGEDIRFWYAESNYHRDAAAGNGAGLPGSCMRYDGIVDRNKNTQSYLDIYCNNQEKNIDKEAKPYQGSCSMLILTNKDNKLIGRAIVWKNLRKPVGVIFMDRIYAIKNSDVELFKKYATEQGWCYKYDQSAHDHSYMQNGQRINKIISISLNPVEYKSYPYMDTLKYYNPTTGRLGSDPGNPVEGAKRWKLEGTGGAGQRVD